MLWGKKAIGLLVVAILIVGLQAQPVLADDWSSTLAVPASRLEPCPREDVNMCVHVKDGPIVSVSIPDSGLTFEGWDGAKNVGGTGPTTVRAAGLTVRRTGPVSSPAPMPVPAPVPAPPAPVADTCSQESMIAASVRPANSDQAQVLIMSVGLPAGFNALTFDGQEVLGGPHVFRIYGSSVTDAPIVQGTFYAVCGDPVAIAMRVATQSGDQIWDMRSNPPAQIK